MKELDNILSQENAVLQSDGTFKVQSNNDVSSNTDNVIQISDDEENENKDKLKCRICKDFFIYFMLSFTNGITNVIF